VKVKEAAAASVAKEKEVKGKETDIATKHLTGVLERPVKETEEEKRKRKEREAEEKAKRATVLAK
jgi:hypothetical protein